MDCQTSHIAPQGMTLKAQNLAVGYREKKQIVKLVHSGLNLELRPGELTFLLGPNGAGKSTLIRTLVGFQPALGGSITIGGKPLSGVGNTEYAKLVSVVLTERTPIGALTVRELVGMGRYPYTNFFGMLHRSDRKVVQTAMEQVGIADLASKYIFEISDGERQKALIAKALAQETPIVVLDEPTAFLDLPSKIEIMSLLHKLAVRTNKSILLSSHDLELALQLADRMWLLAQGRPMVCGVTEDLVLSGSFNSFFEREGISFDAASGSFKLHNPTAQAIHVDGNGVEAQWIANALIRNGFAPSPDPAAEYKVELSEEYPGEYLVYHNSKKLFAADSVEQLLKLLKAS